MMNGRENNSFRIFLRGLKGLKGGRRSPPVVPRGGHYSFLGCWGTRWVLVVVRADRFATLLSEGLGEVVCPYGGLHCALITI